MVDLGIADVCRENSGNSGNTVCISCIQLIHLVVVVSPPRLADALTRAEEQNESFRHLCRRSALMFSQRCRAHDLWFKE